MIKAKELAYYIAEMTHEMGALARRAQMRTLGNLLDAAERHARELVSMEKALERAEAHLDQTDR
jgi:hypothetical protein